MSKSRDIKERFGDDAVLLAVNLNEQTNKRMGEGFSALTAEIRESRAALIDGLSRVRDEMKVDIAEVRQDVRDAHCQKLDKLAAIDNEIHGVKVEQAKLEGEIDAQVSVKARSGWRVLAAVLSFLVVAVGAVFTFASVHVTSKDSKERVRVLEEKHSGIVVPHIAENNAAHHQFKADSARLDARVTKNAQTLDVIQGVHIVRGER